METIEILNEDKSKEIIEAEKLKEFNEEKVLLERKLLQTNTKASRALKIRDCLCTIGGNDILPF